MEKIKIKSIKKLNAQYKRYDIETKNKNFFANGLLIHNSSAHISWNQKEQKVTFFSGGASHLTFISLFDADALKAKFAEKASPHSVTIFGEAYGGKMQGMSATYGPTLKFIVFEVRIGNYWLDVPKAEAYANEFGLEFVPYKRIPATIEAINAERDADSIQAIRNGMGPGHKREGIVLRPIIEFVYQGENGVTIRSKHKNDEFKETATIRNIDDPEKLKVLKKANEIADEWVTHMRLRHVLDSIENHSIEKMRIIIDAMREDVLREGKGEIVVCDETIRAIGKRTALLYKELLRKSLEEGEVK